ncbi:hypothetical protein KBZ21_05650 [Streptomyces sp. A73]|nr:MULTISPECIES: hypothetical protein [unclassified Streptomyces]MBQ0862207.1 hypothetical protein [Streptomyces sp. RK75]MBQ1121801.1 hypothetical protein [Streptomyces sp. B15]MBQ1157652.1 hypothetical protein [Streptomyces sp. A73]
MSARIVHVVTRGTCVLDGGSREVDDKVRLVGDARGRPPRSSTRRMTTV